MSAKHKVVIRRCDTYDADRIAGIVGEAMAELGVVPTGRILLKPNAVIAHPDIFPHAFTRKEFLDGVLAATRARARDAVEIAVGERSGIILPKFKANPWCRLTLSLKNFIGLQDDRHRLVDHNLFLEHKIADLQSVVQPRFIAVDAITAGQKMMLTPTPFDMGVILMGTNSCAVDTVGCHLVNVAPRDLLHLRMAAERGFGPMDLDQIEIGGDADLEDLQRRNRDFEFCLERIDDYFGADTHLRCTIGRFPEEHSPDYCWGGCPGAVQEAMHIFRGFDAQVDGRMRKIHYVVGQVEGPLDLAPDERVVFAGDCTSWTGDIDGRPVKIDSSYRSTTQVDESRTSPYDMLSKVSRALVHTQLNRGSRYIRIRGCPVSVAEHVFYFASLGRIANPLFDPRLLMPITVDYARMHLQRALNHLPA